MTQSQIDAINGVPEDDVATMLYFLRQQNSSKFTVAEIEFLVSAKPKIYSHDCDYIKELFNRILKREAK